MPSWLSWWFLFAMRSLVDVVEFSERGQCFSAQYLCRITLDLHH